MARSNLRVLSWNIDMDTPPVVVRARGLIARIRAEAPDVVCLQEVTAPVYEVLERALCAAPKQPAPDSGAAAGAGADGQAKQPPRYAMHVDPTWPDSLPYFCVLLSRTDRLGGADVTATPFDNSQMFRAALRVDGAVRGARVSVLTSHLESLKDGASRRKAQFEHVANAVRDAADVDGRVCVFAGDTNLRETEVSARLVDKTGADSANGDGDGARAPAKKKRKAARKLGDAWVLCGSPAEHKFTWDMQRNDNLDGFSEFKPRARYDRCFVLAPPERELKVERVRLVGRERLACGRFISDHWGLCVDLSFKGDDEEEAEEDEASGDEGKGDEADE